jgi:hypothetical protein
MVPCLLERSEASAGSAVKSGGWYVVAGGLIE